jgi:hypothetical protein
MPFKGASRQDQGKAGSGWRGLRAPINPLIPAQAGIQLLSSLSALGPGRAE